MEFKTNLTIIRFFYSQLADKIKMNQMSSLFSFFFIFISSFVWENPQLGCGFFFFT